ncbi:hypothetical protein UCREL1_2745 [Eutypa lata UCREL1]|uniref:Uncharacterized protein n=1 Tax=Eutypa lata (strain UCR-EL1) TaxID=1287681 RepID=M7T109_EUTLA|nr:hypothetical protein UCREL1_2745 [Eutypa lata UCREL1]
MHFYKVFLVLMALFWVGLTDFWIYRLRSETQPLHIPFMEYQFFTSAPADCKIVFSHKITLDIAIADPDGFVKLFNLEERPFHLWWMNGMGVFGNYILTMPMYLEVANFHSV